MIDDEGNGIGLVAPVDSGRCGAIGESYSSTTAAPPAARPDAPQGAALESAPGGGVAARRFRPRRRRRRQTQDVPWKIITPQPSPRGTCENTFPLVGG